MATRKRASSGSRVKFKGIRAHARPARRQRGAAEEPPGGRAALVLVPGLLCDALLWQHQVSGLADIAECWVANATRSASMADIADDILDSAPFGEFALAGLSMGGYVAMEIMRRAPGRVSRLALLDTSARADLPEQTERRRALMRLAQGGRFPAVVSALLLQLLPRFRSSDQTLASTIRTMARNVGEAAFIRQQRANIGRIDSRASLRRVRCPTVVICGEQDALTPPERHQEIAAAIPGARLEVIGDCGHLSPLEQPDEVNRVLRDWLT